MDMLKIIFLMIVLPLIGLVPPHGQARDQWSSVQEIAASDLPKEAQATVASIKKGGPFPYSRDGAVFGNFEKPLPLKKRGYYREFTVPTPESRDRGARRIVAGRNGEYYYTDDHYNTFRLIREDDQ